jgi:hypothetical protein
MARKLRQINDSLIGYEPEGREFESLRAHHSFNYLRPLLETVPMAQCAMLETQRKVKAPVACSTITNISTGISFGESRLVGWPLGREILCRVS